MNPCMQALQFNVGIGRYLLLNALGLAYPPAYYGAFSTVRLRELPTPALPDAHWVKIKTTLGGICGSDLNLIHLHDSPSTSPFASMPFIPGHENLGVIVETGAAVQGFAVGDRVVVDPVLACRARGLELCPSCARGDVSTCRNFRRGAVEPGMSIGVCRSTGGSWGEYFVAHESQLLAVPESLEDSAAILVDPLASALHPLLRHFPSDDAHVWVIGAGIVGLLLVASLRALGCQAHITVSARHAYQANWARRLGANQIIDGSGDVYANLAAACSAELFKPILGKRVTSGGFEYVYDCVGSSSSLDDALRFTAPGGHMILVGLAAAPRGVDWTPIWLKEINVSGVVYYGQEQWAGETLSTYQLALRLLAERRIETVGLLTHTFPIQDYRAALLTAADKRHSKAIKVAFQF